MEKIGSAVLWPLIEEEPEFGGKQFDAPIREVSSERPDPERSIGDLRN